MMQRPGGGSYANTWVFPGGAQDSTDPSLGYCALRETFEETGLLIDPKTRLSRFGDRFGDRFEELFRQPGQLVGSNEQQPHLYPVSEWTTPAIVAQKRFTTQFFLTQLAHEPSLDLFVPDKEVVALEWVSPKECLERFSRREIKLFPPQFFLLRYLAEMPVEQVVERLRDRVVKPKPIDKFPGGLTMDWGEEGTARMTMDGKIIDAIEWKL